MDSWNTDVNNSKKINNKPPRKTKNADNSLAFLEEKRAIVGKTLKFISKIIQKTVRDHRSPEMTMM